MAEFKFTISRAHRITGRGVVVVGLVQRGEAHVGDVLELKNGTIVVLMGIERMTGSPMIGLRLNGPTDLSVYVPGEHIIDV